VAHSVPPEARPPVYRGREQTFIKHVILRRYLERVAWNILSWADGFVFVDGFSGPWKSRGARYEDTSFGIAIEELRKVRDGFNAKGKKKRLRCLLSRRGKAPFKSSPPRRLPQTWRRRRYPVVLKSRSARCGAMSGTTSR
jgi:hypothetical protein